MSDIGRIAWSGKINVQVQVDPDLIRLDSNSKKCTVNLQIPRNSYLMMYAPIILAQVSSMLRIPVNIEKDCVWFEYDHVPLYWNYPAGILFDSMTAVDPDVRDSQYLEDDDKLYYWKLKLKVDKKLPDGMLPITYKDETIKKYWLHQWKQVCFVLNGNAKKVMSLSTEDINQFWSSILAQDYDKFISIRDMIVPNIPKRLPLIIYQVIPTVYISSPPNVLILDENSKNITIGDVIEKETNKYDLVNGQMIKVVINGIVIPFDASVLDIYKRFMSFDGYLYLSIKFI